MDHTCRALKGGNAEPIDVRDPEALSRKPDGIPLDQRLAVESQEVVKRPLSRAESQFGVLFREYLPRLRPGNPLALCCHTFSTCSRFVA
jgi:hypothetical protein